MRSHRRALRVAIAEDDDLQRDALQVALEARGFEVLPFEDGFELVDYFTIAGKSDLWPDAIVTDVSMPGRSGLQAVEVARELGSPSPVFVVTGCDVQQVRALAAELSGVLVFGKPIDVERLARAIGDLAEVSQTH